MPSSISDLKPAVTGVSSELSQRIQGQLAASLTPVRPVASIRVCVLRFLAIFLASRPGFVVTMGDAGLRQINTGQQAGIPTWLGMALFGSAALGAITLLFLWREPGTSIGLSWQCSLREFAIAEPAGLLWLLLRRSAPALSPPALGASVGAIAGLFAVSVLQFGCVYQEALHLLLWHWSVLAIVAGAGALLSSWFSFGAQGEVVMSLSPKFSRQALTLIVLTLTMAGLWWGASLRLLHMAAHAILESRARMARSTAPDFSLKDANGRAVRLSDHRGRVVLLNFWAIWRGPCQIEVPWFVEFENRYRAQGFTVLGVSMDKDAGGIESLPTTLLIRRDGGPGFFIPDSSAGEKVSNRNSSIARSETDKARIDERPVRPASEPRFLAMNVLK
jgi:thiol-disulfide isomerase/thioredoxin